MHRNLLISFIAIVVCVTFATACNPVVEPISKTDPAAACNPVDFSLNVRKVFGFNSGNQIKGRFTLALVAPADCVRQVVFKLDDTTVAEVTAPPFSTSIETTAYPFGMHRLNAVVTLLDGSTVATPATEFNFITAAEESQGIKNLLIPLLLGVFGVMLLAVLIQTLVFKGKPKTSVEPGTPRNYGISGGTICPKCGRPFALHLFAPHLGWYKLDRCNNCGKWSVVRPVGMDVLRSAEREELKAAETQVPNQARREEDERKKMIDDSKYTD